MSTLLRFVHDIWCTVTQRCRVALPRHDPDLEWLREQEAASRQSAREIRQRRTGNWQTDVYRGRWRDAPDRG